MILVRDQFFSDEIAQIRKKWCCQNVDGIVDMLYKNQYANDDTTEQGDNLVTPLLKTVKKEKLRGRMTGVKKILSNELIPIK